MDSIVDEKRCGHSWGYLVCWGGFGLEHDEWKSGSEVNDCAALDIWLKSHPY